MAECYLCGHGGGALPFEGLSGSTHYFCDECGGKTGLQKKATKHDAGKTPWHLLPHEAVEGMLQVLAFGAEKYEANQWRRGMEWSRLIGAAYRHLTAVLAGQDIDDESGLPHIDHLMCCVAFLSTYQKLGLGEDDR